MRAEPVQPRERLATLPRPWLDPDELRQLNEAFYGVEPHDYFTTRLELLILAAADPDAIFEAFKKGLEYGGLKAGGPETTRDETEDAKAKHAAFIAADAMNLLQHISETVLRLYLAHAPGPNGKVSPCPWLVVADEMLAHAFKGLVERRFGRGSEMTDARRDELKMTFYGSRDAGADNPDERERVEGSVEEIEKWLHHFAGYFLDDANLYNAMKHGLAVRRGKSFMQVTLPSDAERIAEGKKPLFHADGPSIEYLARKGRDEPFTRRVRWIRPDVAIAEAHMGAYMIEHIWTVGKARYVDGPAGRTESLKLRFYNATRVEQVMDAYLDDEPAKVVIKVMDFPVGYRWAYPPELECTICHRKPRDDEDRPRKKWKGITDGQWHLRPICPDCIPGWRKATS